jgi:tRNA threonylcarbamoyladenosine biosynthesis protein TsaB
MSLILSLETSTSVCSVALHQEGRILATSEIHKEQSHASKLAVLIDEVLKLADCTASQLSAVAISSGPGSYTGLRIGASTAKGLCFALNIPLISVDTLYLMAVQVNTMNLSNAMLCPMIDARRMEVYCLITDAELQVLQPVEAKVIDESSFGDFLQQGRMIFFGNGAMKCEHLLQHAHALFLDKVFPSASMLGILAYEKFQREEFENLVSFEPFYLKEFLVKKPGGN